MSALDTEKLIQAVQKGPALYDKSERDHSDRDIKANLWEAIQAELEVNVDGKNLIFWVCPKLLEKAKISYYMYIVECGELILQVTVLVM